jgi:REP element-mobilizing transposase RayT
LPDGVWRERRRLRSPRRDYTAAGSYFVTVCASIRAPVFGAIVGDEVRLTDAGRLVEACWLEIPEHFQSVRLDAFVVMPDHLHGILELMPARVGAGRACLSVVVGSFKAAVTKGLNERRGVGRSSPWERGFNDHVIRDAADMARIRDYIRRNPMQATP